MNCFGELFLRYRDEIYELLEQQAFDEGRAYCMIDPDYSFCFLCDRHCWDDGMEWTELNRTCDSAQCRELWAWYQMRGRDGSKRRRAFKDHFGKTIWDVEHALRRETILIAMLTIEGRDKANAGKQRLLVAA